MPKDPNNCPLCDRSPADGVRMGNGGQFADVIINCPLCGSFELVGEGAVAASWHWDLGLRSALSCATRQATEAGEQIRITAHNAEDLAAPHMHTMVSDNQERLLRQVAKRAGRPHQGAFLSFETDFTVIDCFSPEEFRWYIEWVENQKLALRTGAGPSGVQLTLSMDGWSRVQPFPRPGGIPGNCFVAMWFSEDLRAAYELGIEPAIADAGLKPIRIDRKEHNNEITDEIMSEIRNCQVMVADFTGQRGGVYYEAGFAMGLGRPVIWSCRKDEIEKLHFDTNHKNHIAWETPADVRQKLYNRIRATILDQG
jgi:hypothetical protein